MQNYLLNNILTFLLTYLINYLLSYLITYFLLTYWLAHSMEQSPSWEANRFSASQEIPHILWNQKVHYRNYKRQPTVPILSQLDPIHTLKSYFLKIHFNIIISSNLGSNKWSLSQRFPRQKPCIRICSPQYVLHATPISFFSILSPEQYLVSSTDH